jgi:hypothetical protein
MHATAVALYLAVIYTGAAVVSIAESFSASEIKARLELLEVSLVVIQVHPLCHLPRFCFGKFLPSDPAHTAKCSHTTPPAVVIPAIWIALLSLAIVTLKPLLFVSLGHEKSGPMSEVLHENQKADHTSKRKDGR